MKTAIVILNYNDYDNTTRYLTEIKDYKVIDKIVVVDNKSTDEKFNDLLKLKNEKIDIIQSDKNGGYSYGNNFGIKYLENNYKDEYYDYIIISNSDVSVSESTINSCLDVLQKKDNIAVVAPRMFYLNGPARRGSWKIRTYLRDIANSTRLTELFLYPIFKNGEYSYKDYEDNQFMKVECISGAFFIIRHDILKEINYFDENVFLFYEEDILGYKLKEKNYDIISINTEKFMHYESQTIGKVYSLFKKQTILRKSKKYFHKKYNNVNALGLCVFDILYIIRCIELIIEIPLRKLIKGNN